MLENRRWLVIPTSATGSINFDQVKESSIDSLRLSVDGSKTFIKYDVMVVEITTTETQINAETGDEMTITTEAGIYGRPDIYSEEYTEYTHEEILELLSTTEWTTPIENK
jgi:hypothetical protein